MSKPLKFSYNGGLATEVDIVAEAFKRVESLPADVRTEYINQIKQTFSNYRMRSKFQTIFLPIIGVVFLVGILYLAYFTPFPTAFQSGVFWLVLSLGAAGFASLIPGFIEFKYQKFLRAGGALAVFCLMYFFSPDIINKTNQSVQNKIELQVVQDDGKVVQSIAPDFDMNSRVPLYKAISESVNNYYGSSFGPEHYTLYRASDGKVYTAETCNQLREFKILVIPNAVVAHFKNKREAYLKFVNKGNAVIK
ncbi:MULTISPECIES: hypothetical protein [unclassified Mucilaginibacter]|uniref:hypothetical protein n=1 Tax=unclassified Mucilaginibacter TaxID=2617802 RepID=UPI001BD6329E|nr:MULTISPECIES: hypothetical protein [unclassified Mucilaginibacter]MCC8425793.1 hypothetical protein [Mucilaginibacter sp. UR6-11]